MKKFIYAMVIAISACALFTSCTEEEVAPRTSNSNTSGGGGAPSPYPL